MPRNQNRHFRRPAVQAEITTESPGISEKEYHAPIVGLEDKIFTVGTTAHAAKFEIVKEDLGKHFDTQTWSDGADATMAFETLTELTYLEPWEPDIPVKFIVDVDGVSTQDPECKLKLMLYKMQISKYGHELDRLSKMLRTGRTFVLVCLPLSYSIVQQTWYRGLSLRTYGASLTWERMSLH
eukprot:15354420-Ditylum_brightwellii.AAC.1